MKIRAFSNPCSIWRNKKKKELWNHTADNKRVSSNLYALQDLQRPSARISFADNANKTNSNWNDKQRPAALPLCIFQWILTSNWFFFFIFVFIFVCLRLFFHFHIHWYEGARANTPPTIAVWLFMSYSIRNCFTFTFDFFPHHIRGRNSMPWITNCLLILVFSLLKCHRVVSNFNNCTCRQRVTRATYTQLPHLHPRFSFLLFAL